MVLIVTENSRAPYTLSASPRGCLQIDAHADGSSPGSERGGGNGGGNGPAKPERRSLSLPRVELALQVFIADQAGVTWTARLADTSRSAHIVVNKSTPRSPSAPRWSNHAPLTPAPP